MQETEHANEYLQLVDICGEPYYKIENIDRLRPFFMSIVCAHDHWMFISSNGGLTAGRVNAESALFPYYTDDKITESADITGSKTIFQITLNGDSTIWEPFSTDKYERYRISRNLYKNQLGNKVLFEEVNHDLSLTFRYQWSSSDTFGFVRQSTLINHGSTSVFITLLDGIQNILAACVGSELQNGTSNLVDAYKRNELDESSGLGIFALSAIIVDRAEPSEALTANIAWSYGLDQPTYLLSSLQLVSFRKSDLIQQETDIKAEKGAYFVSSKILLEANDEKVWSIVADVDYNHSSVVNLIKEINENAEFEKEVLLDIEKGSKDLVKLVASSDGLQLTSDNLKDTRHFANVMFNLMRGGVVDQNYKLEKSDIADYLQNANQRIFKSQQEFIEGLPDKFDLFELRTFLVNTENASLIRLLTEYLPIKFSRRHGDPSRPWNKFSINIRNKIDGSKVLDYEGNWRDIFQNWEALAYSFPDFIEGMIFKFLNASTFDGYNPYRVTKDGFDWETIEPDDPWTYIGYWGDHQIIYLLKLLECLDKHHEGQLRKLFDQKVFAYAEVPYRIKSYEDILKNSKDTIEFDVDWDKNIRERREQVGSDGALWHIDNKSVNHVNFIEKILATLLAKMSNFIPEAGIWLNTQRPEWNDANNALVGNGVSMVTLYYLRRFLVFFEEHLENENDAGLEISTELHEYFNGVNNVLLNQHHSLKEEIDDTRRKEITDQLSSCSSTYRMHIYKNGFKGNKQEITIEEVKSFFKLCRDFLEHSIDINQSEDHLYHAYNIIDIKDNSLSISHLTRMLEGQVAVLSSGYLNSEQAVELLDSLKKSALYREDQSSYILYPNKDLPGFLEKNSIPKEEIKKSRLLILLEEDDNHEIIQKDNLGAYHFNSNFKNSNDLENALNELNQSKYSSLVSDDRNLILNIYEGVFNHKEFTGRSGTFYGYEGLGSIYWHMVSKLVLAVYECCTKAVDDGASPEVITRLTDHFHNINAGIGIHKKPKVYGAFTTDPYSHTPGGKGAQQPGMTGQVKEDILSRFGELGIQINKGQISFLPQLLTKNEFISKTQEFKYVDVNGKFQNITLKEGSLSFTYCQVPIIYKRSDQNKIEIVFGDERSEIIKNSTMSQEYSSLIFKRTGEIEQIHVYIDDHELV